MRKIYSFVLMATMLLIGTNVKADVTDWSGLSSAVSAAPANELTTITLGGNITMPNGAVLLVNGNKNIELNLNGKNITEPTDVYYPIQVIGGTLTIKGSGTISATYAAILKVEGSETDVANYSVLNVENGVNMTSSAEYGVVVRQAGSSKHSYGVVVNFDGYVSVTGNEGTALWILGNIKDTEGNIPQITIGPNATLIGASNGVGYYAGGYAENTIQGSISGGAGVYAKAGEITIDGGTVQATSTSYSAPSANPNGFSGGMGCAIVSDSHKGYQGEMEITIKGNATLGTDAGEGFAIKEAVTDNNNQTKTESLVIESGTINGDLSTTAELKENIILNGTITGGTYSGNVTEYLNNDATDFEIVGGKYVIKVAVDVTLNGYGYATFSAKKNVELPSSGLTAWKATALNGTALETAEVTGIIPANTGVILVGAANGEFKLIETETDASAITGNLMKPATAFDADYGKNIYILHGNELWLYTGNEFKANKAYLLIGGSNAPKRISFHYDAPTAVENVEAEAIEAQKFIENGQVLIKRGENIYNAQGQIVK